MPVYETDVCEEYRPEVKPEAPPELNGGAVFLAWRFVIRNQTQFVALPVTLNGEMLSTLFSRGVWRIVRVTNLTQQEEAETHFDRHTEVD
jgi:hypothetical protein